MRNTVEKPIISKSNSYAPTPNHKTENKNLKTLYHDYNPSKLESSHQPMDYEMGYRQNNQGNGIENIMSLHDISSFC